MTRLLLEGVDGDGTLAHLLYHPLHARAGGGDILAALGGQLAHLVGIVGRHAAVVRDTGGDLHHLFTVVVQGQRMFGSLAAALADCLHPVDRGVNVFADVLVVVHSGADHLLQFLDETIHAVGQRTYLVIPLQVDAGVEISLAGGDILHSFVHLQQRGHQLAGQPEAAESDHDQAQQQATQQQGSGLADDAVELGHLILYGSIAALLDGNQLLSQLIGTDLIGGLLGLIAAERIDPLSHQLLMPGQQGAILCRQCLAGKFAGSLDIEQPGAEHAVDRFVVEIGRLFQLGLDRLCDSLSAHLFQRIELAQKAYVGLHPPIGRFPAGGEAAVPANGLVGGLGQRLDRAVADHLQLGREAGHQIGVVMQCLIHLGIGVIERQQLLLLLLIGLLVLFHGGKGCTINELPLADPGQRIIGRRLGSIEFGAIERGAVLHLLNL